MALPALSDAQKDAFSVERIEESCVERDGSLACAGARMQRDIDGQPGGAKLRRGAARRSSSQQRTPRTSRLAPPAEQALGAGPDALVDGHEGGQGPGDEEEQCAEVEQIGALAARRARHAEPHAGEDAE